MINTIIKEGYFLEIPHNVKKKTDAGLNLNKWLRKELKRIGVPVSDPCCNDIVIPPSGTDTRLHNPHITGNNLVFDILNTTTLAVTPNAVSVALPTDAIVNITIAGNTLTYTNKAGVSTNLTLPAATPETALTAVDSATIDFTTSGAANHTLTAVVKPSTTNGHVLTTVAGVATWVAPVAVSSTTEKVDSYTSLNSGTVVTLTSTPAAGTLPLVFRNGRFQLSGPDYTIAGTTITFSTAFGVSGGVVGPEQVAVHYKF